MAEAKTLEALKKDELIKAAEFFGTDYKPSQKKGVIAAALAEDGVTFAMYEKQFATEATEPKDVVTDSGEAPKATAPAPAAPADPGQLVKMTRNNASFQIRGQTFTREHPYRLVAGADLDYILGNVEGFRLATPAEVQSYYN